MTDNVVDMQSFRPHLSGLAICGACGHEWTAVCEIGTTDLECPNCERVHGCMKAECVPEEFWQCECGHTLFYLTRDGAMCRMCGLTHTDWGNS